MPQLTTIGQGSTTVGTPVDVTPAIGTSTAYARADHIHDVAAGVITQANTTFQTGNVTVAAGSGTVNFATAYGAAPTVLAQTKLAGIVIRVYGVTAAKFDWTALDFTAGVTTSSNGAHTHTLDWTADPGGAGNQDIWAQAGTNRIFGTGGAGQDASAVLSAGAHTHTSSVGAAAAAVNFDWVAIG